MRIKIGVVLCLMVFVLSGCSGKSEGNGVGNEVSVVSNDVGIVKNDGNNKEQGNSKERVEREDKNTTEEWKKYKNCKYELEFYIPKNYSEVAVGMEDRVNEKDTNLLSSSIAWFKGENFLNTIEVEYVKRNVVEEKYFNKRSISYLNSYSNDNGVHYFYIEDDHRDDDRKYDGRIYFFGEKHSDAFIVITLKTERDRSLEFFDKVISRVKKGESVVENGCVDGFNKLINEEWSTYRDDEYGFLFKYPNKWGKGQVLEKIYVNTINYHNSPEKLGPDDFALILTKGDLKKRKNEIESEELKNILHINDLVVLDDVRYSVPGGIFVKEIEFFIGLNRITVYVELPVMKNFVWGRDKEEIDVVINDIKKNGFNEEVRNVLIDFDKVVSSLKLLK